MLKRHFAPVQKKKKKPASLGTTAETGAGQKQPWRLVFSFKPFLGRPGTQETIKQEKENPAQNLSEKSPGKTFIIH
jgi:hypothetical protein